MAQKRKPKDKRQAQLKKLRGELESIEVALRDEYGSLGHVSDHEQIAGKARSDLESLDEALQGAWSDAVWLDNPDEKKFRKAREDLQDPLARTRAVSDALTAASEYGRQQIAELTIRKKALKTLLDPQASAPDLINRFGIFLIQLLYVLPGMIAALAASFFIPWLGMMIAMAALFVPLAITRSWQPIREAMQDYPLVRSRPENAMAASPFYSGLCALMLALNAALFAGIVWRMFR